MLGRHRFPWRDGHDVALLRDGENFFPAMLKSIARARSQIYFELYLVSSSEITSQFIQALIDAADRGVEVYILWDEFGSIRLAQKDKRRLEHNNIFLRFYNPLKLAKLRKNLFRDHRKLLLIDMQFAYVGGFGLSSTFLSKSDSDNWRETVIRITGPCVKDWATLFEEAWGKQIVRLAGVRSVVDPVKCISARVSYATASGRHEITASFIKAIRLAERDIWFVTAYFVPNLKLRRALRQAALRGVSVRILVPGKQSDHPTLMLVGRRYYKRLLRAGVEIYEYQPRFTHSKIQVCDDWVSIGSSNLDRWNFIWNLEANQELSSSCFSHDIKALLRHDIKESERVTISDLEARSWYMPWLERLLHRGFHLITRLCAKK